MRLKLLVWMASKAWIERTVNTAGRPCPVRLGELCPGTRQGCAWWLDEILEGDGSTELRGGCGVMWLYAIQLEVRSEAIRTQAGLDKAATQISRAGEQVSSAIVAAAQARLLADGGAVAAIER